MATFPATRKLAASVVGYRDLMSLGHVENGFVISQFGEVENLPATFVPVTAAQVYRMPPPSAAVQLDIVSNDPNDTAAGSGVRSVILRGLDENMDRAEFIVALNGTTPVPVPGLWTRLSDALILTTGTYAQTATSHSSLITIDDRATADIWGLLPQFGTLGMGSAEIGCYTVPRGYTAIFAGGDLVPDANQGIDIVIQVRPFADDETGNYGFVNIREARSVDQAVVLNADVLLTPIEGPADIVFLARAAGGGTPACAVNFNLLVEKNT